jgi:hypothetical protein
MMRDDKLVSAAVRSKQPVERVVWVWGCILESAAEINDGGRYEIDHAEMAYFLRADEGDLVSIEGALGALGRVRDGAVVHWSERQFQSDQSAARQRRHRDSKKRRDGGYEPVTAPSPDAASDGGVTSSSHHGDAPETETETERTDANASVSAPAAEIDAEVEAGFAEFNAMASDAGWPIVRSMTAPRRARLKKLLNKVGASGWSEILTRARASPFLCGANGSGWRADFDFLLRPSSIAKLLEGSYDDKPAGIRTGQSGSRPRESILDGVARAAEARLGGHRWETGIDVGLPGDRGSSPPDRGSGVTIEGELSGRPG